MDDEEIVGARIGNVTITRDGYLDSSHSDHIRISRPADAELMNTPNGFPITIIYKDKEEVRRVVNRVLSLRTVDYGNAGDSQPESVTIYFE